MQKTENGSLTAFYIAVAFILTLCLIATVVIMASAGTGYFFLSLIGVAIFGYLAARTLAERL